MVRIFRIVRAVLLFLTLSLIFIHLTPVDADAGWYVYGGDGYAVAVIKPFSTRILYPTVVHLLKVVAGISTADSFLVVGLAAAICFVVANYLMVERVTNGRAVLPWLCLPAIVGLLRQYLVPDLPHAGELAVFFLLLSKRCFIASLSVLLAAQLTRESTVLLAAVAACVFWRDSKRAISVAVLLSSGVGIAIAAVVTRAGVGNQHELGPIQYLALKVPFNVARNVFGVELWSNTLSGKAAWKMDLPHWVHMGAIRQMGFADFVPIYPLKTFQFALTAFGLAPAVITMEAWRHFRNRRNRPVAGESPPLWLRVALYYGVAAYLIAPCLGASISRLFSYAWPASVLATPAILWRRRPATNVEIGATPHFRFLVTAHVLAPWLQWAVDLIAPFDRSVVTSCVAVGAALQVWAFRQLWCVESMARPCAPGTGPHMMTPAEDQAV
jgi:hypothetical protein